MEVPSEAATKVTEAASTAVFSIIKDSVLGALLIIAVLGVIWLLRKVVTVQDQRIADQKAANEAMERQREKVSDLALKMVHASTQLNASIEKLTDSTEDHTKAIAELRSSFQELKNVVDSVIRDAVRRRSSGQMPEVQAPMGTGYSHVDRERQR